MAFMVLLRLPSTEELAEHQLEAQDFFSAFVEHSVAPFVAKVGYKKGLINLGDWTINDDHSEWYNIIE